MSAELIEPLEAPLLNGAIRDTAGRFAPGTKAGPGNPFSKQINQLRSALYRSITEGNVNEIIQNMIFKACDPSGKDAVAAAKLVLGYVVSQPHEIGGDEPDEGNMMSVRVLVPRDKALALLSEKV